MNSGSFSRKSSTVSNLGGFLLPPLVLKCPIHFMRHVAPPRPGCLVGFLFLRSVSGQQLVASVRMYLILFQRRGGVPTL